MGAFLFASLYGKILKRGFSMSKLKNLLSAYPNSRIYLHFETSELARRFLADAEAEGFTFGDGVKPTERSADSIFALNDDMTINYVGFVGHMAFASGTDKVGDKKLVRIEYGEI